MIQESFKGPSLVMIGFGLLIKANWYESTILTKGRTTEMKWTNWPFLLDLPPPIHEAMQAIHDRCRFMGISYRMGLRS
jgi:hypothetical protein